MNRSEGDQSFSPSSLRRGLGSILWGHTEDKCKKKNKSSNRDNSKRQNSHGCIERLPKQFDKEERPFFYQPILKKRVQEEGRKSVKCTIPISSFQATSLPDVPNRRVHFSLAERNEDEQQTLISVAKLFTRCLIWTNHKGVVGTYTGQVNKLMQPHGSGTFICENGSVKTCIWSDGMPIKGWKPKNKNMKEKSPDQQVSTLPLSPSSNQTTSTRSSNSTYLHHINIGDVATPQDTVQEESNTSKIDSLQVHDFAFILRSDGHSWTYAIIADRQDDGILFVVDTRGSTKILTRKYWSTRIRIVR